MEEEVEDPFVLIIKNCILTASQEEKLRNCPFARESEASPEHSNSVSSSPAPTPSEQTAIFMVSPPGSGSVGQNTPRKNGVFRIPSEHATSSSQPYLSGSECPRPPTTTASVDSQLEAPGDDQTVVDDEDCTENQRAVDLGKECDDLGFSKPQKVNLGGGVSGPEGRGGVNKVRGNKVYNGHGSLKRIRISKELGMQSPMLNKDEAKPIIIGIKHNDNVQTEVIDLECEEVAEKEGLAEEKTTVNVESPVQESNACTMVGDRGKMCENFRKSFESKSIEDIGQYKYAKSCNDDARGKKKRDSVVGRRELPWSMRCGEKSVKGEEEARRVDMKNGSFKDLVEALQVVFGKASDGFKDVGFLETAKRRGWDFPRPRWWPPEGFHD